jgi:hypothetical protein
MKKAEAISILATSVRPREAKDRARYDEAVKMAIEALKCSETPKSSERTSETAQADHIADIGKKVCVDTISRQAAIDALARMMPRSYTPDGSHPSDEEIFRAQEVFADCIEALEILPSAQPEIIRCKDCKHRDKYGCCKYWKGLAMGDIPIATDDYDFCSYAKQKGEQCERKL